MHAYEMIRDGKIADLLTADELQQFNSEGYGDSLQEVTTRIADVDEAFYLSSMREVIESCQQPYFKRKPVLEKIHRDLEAKAETAEYPLVAGRLLLKDLMAAQAIQARDRANTEAWTMALAAMVGADQPPVGVNPLTGQRYKLIERDDTIIVSNIGPGDEGSEIAVPVVGQRGRP
jgi:hypothetical protein